jgi:hypothetical protein
MGDKIKKLSDAIRLGATFRPQCRRTLFDLGSSCAIGAAYEALTGINTTEGYNLSTSPSVEGLLARRFGVSMELLDEVIGWNDHERLTREQIADRLEAKGL